MAKRYIFALIAFLALLIAQLYLLTPGNEMIGMWGKLLNRDVGVLAGLTYLAAIQSFMLLAHKISSRYVLTAIFSGITANILGILLSSAVERNQWAGFMLFLGIPYCIALSLMIGAPFKWARLVKDS